MTSTMLAYITDASQLDMWVFERVHDFLESARADKELRKKLLSEKVSRNKDAAVLLGTLTLPIMLMYCDAGV